MMTENPSHLLLMCNYISVHAGLQVNAGQAVTIEKFDEGVKMI